jgi:hypothetical protein
MVANAALEAKKLYVHHFVFASAEVLSSTCIFAARRKRRTRSGNEMPVKAMGSTVSLIIVSFYCKVADSALG